MPPSCSLITQGALEYGPLARGGRDMPVTAIAPNDALIEKLKSNIQEVRLSGGELYVIAAASNEMVEGEGVYVLNMPKVYSRPLVGRQTLHLQITS